LIKPEKLMTFSGQKRWIFLLGIRSPGKVRNNGIQEVVGSIPIGSTNILNGLWVTAPIRFSIVTTFVTETHSFFDCLSDIFRSLAHILATTGLNWYIGTENGRLLRDKSRRIMRIAR
jgi:hypothetical protein